jgi:hypothetical protein
MAWVETQVARNQFENVEDYLVQLVEKERAQQERLKTVRRALVEGRESGMSPTTADILLADWLNPGGARERDLRRQALAAGRASGVCTLSLETILELALSPIEEARVAA